MKHPAALLALALALLAGPTLAQDVIHLRDGRSIEGVRIEKEAFDKVEFKKRGSTQNVSTADVREIVYGRTSAEFVQAMTAERNGEMAAAAGLFLAAHEDEDLPAHVRATALVEAGEALLANGSFEGARDTFGSLIQQYGDSRHLAQALLGRGKAQFFGRDAQAADESFKRLQAEVAAKKFDQRWALEAEFFLLWSAEAQGKPDIVQGYKALRERTQDSYQGIANKCSLRLGRVLLGQDPPAIAEARDLFDEIIESRLETDVDIAAGAFNGRGRCHFAQAQRDLSRVDGQGRPAPDPEAALTSFEAARFDFLRVVLNYKGVTREQPEALYWAGRSFLAVAPLDGSEQEAELRGKQLLQLCQEQFPKSEWGQKAGVR